MKNLEGYALIALVLFTLFTLFTIGCGSTPPVWTAYTAEAVYLNEPGSVSILMRNEDNSLSVKKFYVSTDALIIKDDIVDSRAHPWVSVEQESEMGDLVTTKITVHVHSIKEIQPGHWNHGKFGQGQDQQIE